MPYTINPIPASADAIPPNTFMPDKIAASERNNHKLKPKAQSVETEIKKIWKNFRDIRASRFCR